MQYVVTDQIISKSVSHFKDCKERKFRVVDDYRGFRCDGDWALQARQVGDQWLEGQTGPEPLYSTANTAFMVEARGDKYHVQKMVMSASVAAQFYETEGVSSFINVNRSFTLKNIKTSDGSLRPSNSEMVEITDLTFETNDDNYQWNSDRDLKGVERFWSFQDELLEEIPSQTVVQQQLLLALSYLRENLHFDGKPNQEQLNNLHKFGALALTRVILLMDYDNILDTYTKLKAGATDDEGKAALNMFREFLVEAGTSAAALALRDLVLTGVIDNDSEAARALSGVAFHLRRPSLALVTELAEILESKRLDLALASLIERTCTLAGHWNSPAKSQCLTQLSDVWAEKYFVKLSSATSLEEQLTAVSFLANLKSVKAMELMRPVAYGQQEDVSCSVQVKAIKASFWGTVFKQNTKQFFLPIFMNTQNCHPARIAALDQLFVLNGDIDVTTLSTIMTQMFAEPDNEVCYLNISFNFYHSYCHCSGS